ncbi:MAG: AAA family ATPase [Stellaceae bacterium]
MTMAEVADACRGVLDALSRVIVGKEAVLRQIMAGILANGHILIEDNPGLAKTLIARLFGEALDLTFGRIQFTPDLLPSDITGSSIYDQREGRFVFRPGPVFANLLLGDEINRATPKTQSALLEAMQEAQVTVEGVSHPLEPPFFVIATQNPIELEGTYPLLEAQLDRFLMRIAVGYPEREEEREILRRRRERRQEAARVPTLLSRGDLLALQAAIEEIYLEDSVADYIVDLARASRADGRVALGVSPRGSLALQGLARAEAALDGRDFVTPDDVKRAAVPVLAHRLVLKPELWAARLSAITVIDDILKQVPTPEVER